MKPTFECDEKKAKENLRDHQVDFDEAETVFDDALSISISDPDHSEDEERFIDIGESDRGRILVISYTERGRNIRLISARLASSAERIKYEEEDFD